MYFKVIEIKERFLGKDDYEVVLFVGYLAFFYNYDMEKFFKNIFYFKFKCYLEKFLLRYIFYIFVWIDIDVLSFYNVLRFVYCFY